MRSVRLRWLGALTVAANLVCGCTAAGGQAGPATATPGSTAVPPASATTATNAASAATPSAESGSPKASPAATLATATELAAKAPAGATSIDMTPDADKPRFKPDKLTVSAGTATATFFLTGIPISGTFGPFHDMIIGPEIGTPIATSRSVQPGTSAVFTVEGLRPGTYQFWCNTNTGHGLHYKLGMVGTLTVTP